MNRHPVDPMPARPNPAQRVHMGAHLAHGANFPYPHATQVGQEPVRIAWPQRRGGALPASSFAAQRTLDRAAACTPGHAGELLNERQAALHLIDTAADGRPSWARPAPPAPERPARGIERLLLCALVLLAVAGAFAVVAVAQPVWIGLL